MHIRGGKERELKEIKEDIYKGKSRLAKGAVAVVKERVWTEWSQNNDTAE